MPLLRLCGRYFYWGVNMAQFLELEDTDTCSLSAIMLGRLRMSVEEALANYLTFGRSVFGQARWWHERSILYFPRAKYPSRKIRGALVEVIYNKLKQNDDKMTPWRAKHEPFKSREDQTRTRVLLHGLERA
jgi:hypothetical protein